MNNSLIYSKEPLKHQLQDFNPIGKNEDEIFSSLAIPFLYGGYLSVTYNGIEQYRIFIRTVEFYCHHEGENIELPRDLIVYHRNDHYVQGNVPYFPLMSLHAHASGFDVTFENEKLELRSSALIRAYEVYDMINGYFLFYDREKKMFRESYGENESVNKQSTYLYDFLNGFIGESVKWVDAFREPQQDLKISSRQNVFLFDENGIKQPNKKDTRPWSFTRMDAISVIR